MKLIIINWLPATGKTTLAKKVSKDLNIPCYSKDDFKEIAYEEIWYQTWEEKKKLEVLSFRNLYYILEKNLISNTDVILEANFYAEYSNEVFNNFRDKFDFDIIQIKCITEWRILLNRFKKRSLSKDRHPLHKDNSERTIKKWQDVFLKWEWEKLDIWWKYIELDTSDFNKIDYDKLYKNIL